MKELTKKVAYGKNQKIAISNHFISLQSVCYWKKEVHFGPSMMSQGKNPWKDPLKSVNWNLRGLSRWIAPIEAGKTYGGSFPGTM